MIEHIVLAVLILVLIALVTRSLAAGAAAACAWAVSREMTQAEYRWIEHYGGGLRANMPWWGGFDLRVWQYADPWFDWIVPSLVAIAVAAFASRATKRSVAEQEF
ncbi:MAG TPA: hypothetical protein VNI79_02700 [Sphingomicrobium sp.]|nr:hypothetical protein [Sphingomicrobium sp.]